MEYNLQKFWIPMLYTENKPPRLKSHEQTRSWSHWPLPWHVLDKSCFLPHFWLSKFFHHSCRLPHGLVFKQEAPLSLSVCLLWFICQHVATSLLTQDNSGLLVRGTPLRERKPFGTGLQLAVARKDTFWKWSFLPFNAADGVRSLKTGDRTSWPRQTCSLVPHLLTVPAGWNAHVLRPWLRTPHPQRLPCAVSSSARENLDMMWDPLSLSTFSWGPCIPIWQHCQVLQMNHYKTGEFLLLASPRSLSIPSSWADHPRWDTDLRRPDSVCLESPLFLEEAPV